MSEDGVVAYCINLARRPDRWAKITERCAKAGVRPVRFDAVDGADPVNSAAIARMKQTGPTGAMGKGTLATTLSHTALWRKLLASEGTAERFLIIEDDVEFAPGGGAVLADLLANDYGHDLIKLGIGRTLTVMLGPALPIASGAALRDSFGLALGALGYIMTRKGLKAALARVDEIDVAIDHFLFYPQRRKGVLGLPYAVTDPICMRQVQGERSDISPIRMSGARWRRDLARAPYEAATVSSMLRGLTFHRARVVSLEFPEPADGRG